MLLRIYERNVYRIIGHPLTPVRPSKAKVSWALMFAAKILGFVAVVDVLVFPILWILRAEVPQAYIPIIGYEGFCISLIGGLLLFTSPFSTVEQENHRYLGFGTSRYGLRSRKLTKKEKHVNQQRGILMAIIGMLLFLFPMFIVILNRFVRSHICYLAMFSQPT